MTKNKSVHNLFSLTGTGLWLKCRAVITDIRDHAGFESFLTYFKFAGYHRVMHFTKESNLAWEYFNHKNGTYKWVSLHKICLTKKKQTWVTWRKSGRKAQSLKMRQFVTLVQKTVFWRHYQETPRTGVSGYKFHSVKSICDSDRKPRTAFNVEICANKTSPPRIMWRTP